MRFYHVILACLLAGITAAAGQVQAPSIEFDATVMDAGKVTQGKLIKHTFTFTNKGSGALEIIGMEPS